MNTPTSQELGYSNLLDLTPSDRDVLKQRISDQGATVRAFVHPFYILHRQRARTQPASPQSAFWLGHYAHERMNSPSLPFVEQAFRDAVLTDSSHQPPLLVFEEHEQIQGLIDEFRDHSLLPYIIPTGKNQPTPLLPDPRYDSPWTALRETLRDLGVRNIHLGGMLAPLCVTVTRHELQKAFYVETSLPIHPQKIR